MRTEQTKVDVIVVGGGNIGSAIAYGLVENGVSVALLDEGDVALRAARGNFGLIWFQGKGLGMQRYVDWCLEATQKWPDFAEELEKKTGITLQYRQSGGFFLCRSEADYEERREMLEQLRQQSDRGQYDCELLERSEIQKRIPKMALGPDIVGATFSPHDGDVNPLYLLRALHDAFLCGGGRYFPGTTARAIQHDGRTFAVQTPKGSFRAQKLVLAAGVGIPRLAAMLDMQIPVRPQRGQLLVTERVKQVLPYPISGIRQTGEGSFMLGTSNEEVGFDTHVTLDVARFIARRAMAAFPELSGVRIVRSWAALRPLTPDSKPIYHQSERYPGAFVLTSHSGVSLAPLYATHLAHWIIAGDQPEGFEHFSLQRFAV